MPSSAIKFDILEIARDFLFVEDADFYPPEIWEDFAEALYLFLTDDEIDVLNYRYGNGEFCRFSAKEIRRILSGLALRFTRSEFYSEMDAIMTSWENGELADTYGNEISTQDAQAERFVRGALAKIGLDYAPGSVGQSKFDSMISNFPVFVWRHSDAEVSLRVLKNMLGAAGDAGFGRFFIVANPRLTIDLPFCIDGCIPHTFIPLIDDSFETDGFTLNDQQLNM